MDLLKLNLRNPYPESPLVGTSTRRNCPCCIETFNFALLDTPSSRITKKNQAARHLTTTNINFRVLYKNYSSGNILKVVRRKPVTPISVNTLQKIKLDDYISDFGSRKFNKRLSITMDYSKSHAFKKNLAAVYKEKDLINTVFKKNKNYSQDELNKL